MRNNDWTCPDEFKPLFEKMNQIEERLSPVVDALYRNNLQLNSILRTNISSEMLCKITETQRHLADLTVFSKQLSEVFPTFQLSVEVKDFIREAKESERLSEEEFEKKYGEELEICKTLGVHGWVVSAHGNPRIIRNWHEALIENEPGKITYFFEEDQDHVIKIITNDLAKKYDDPVNRNYYARGIKAFQNNDYMTCAMYFVGLLEARVNALVKFPPRTKYRDKFSDKAFAHKKQEQFAKSNSFIIKRYYFLDAYPSLIAFLNRLFIDGEYSFERGVEPPYVNRNWLLHGKCCREIKRFECIQILNALEMAEIIL